MQHKIIFLLSAVAGALCCGPATRADQKVTTAKGDEPRVCECRIEAQRLVHAADWAEAWQAAKEGCPEANAVTLQIVDRSGPEIRGVKIFECVDLKTAGELLVIRIRKGDKQDEAVMIIRAVDLIRIEVSRRPASQD